MLVPAATLHPVPLVQAVAQLATAIALGQAQATALAVVALERPALQYQQLCSVAAVQLTVLDGFSDPYAWASPLAGSSNSSSTSCDGGRAGWSTVPLTGILAAPNGLQLMEQHLLDSSSSSGSNGAGGQPLQVQQQPQQQRCIVFDSLSPLLHTFGAPAVAALLHRLAAAPSTSCLLAGLHADLHAPSEVAAVEQLAAGSLALQPVSELERTVCAAAHGAGRQPQGRLALRLKRRSGRVRAESRLYCIDAAGGVSFLELPPDMLSPAAVAEKAAAAAAGASGVVLGAMWWKACLFEWLGRAGQRFALGSERPCLIGAAGACMPACAT